METTDTEKEAFYPIFNVYSRVGHVCASVQNNVIVWGGYRNDPDIFAEKYLPSTKINVYHTDHRYWTAHETTGYIPPGTSGACAVIIDHKLYVFAGHTRNGNTNCLYYLDLTTLCWTNLTPTLATDDENEEQGVHKGDINVNHKGDFNVDHKGDNNKKEEQLWPSPRDKFTMWSYKHRLYCFGGFGPNFTCDNLGVHGQFVYGEEGNGLSHRGWNNQLLVYDTITNTWTNPACKGTAPLPRAAHAAARSRGQVYIFGGRHRNRRMNDLHCLDLDSLTWSGELFVDGACPCGRSWHTLTAASDDVAFLYGGYSEEGVPLDDAWQLHYVSRQWTQVTVRERRPRLWHTCACTSDGDLLVFGGCENDILNYEEWSIQPNDVLSLRIQPARLQRLCLETASIYKEVTSQSWEILPKHLCEWLVRRQTIEELRSGREAEPNPVPHGAHGQTCAIS
ncbi:kelch domain-containing protein 2-like [Mya arenaria]|uniref:kelch domain-containing protein 2-like n=1 Tax=Mya arenaria TaxID=6604 RepID=UPI0022E136F9|nr:kelch domain-containing protein 2-like [Mya arenaria]